ncbi:MAG: GntR family transcriptional regulator [Planctomycetota bacterium]
MVSRELRIEIASGAFAPSGKLPSEAQLVERFGVSRPTVARALRDLQNENLVERRAGSGTFVRIKSSSQTQSQVLGLLIPDRGTTEIFEAICGELGALARVNGFGLLWGGSPLPYADRDSTPEHAVEVCQHFIDKAIAGVFFAPLERAADSEKINRMLLEQLRQSGTPVVLLDRDVTSFPNRSHFDLVSLDNFRAGYMLAKHLIRLGSKQIRFVAREGSAPTVDARIGGVREAIVKNGQNCDARFVSRGDPADTKFVSSLKIGRSCDAIVCANDHTAAELLKTLSRLSIDVPSTVRVVGFDDVRYATLLSVSLTTISQPCREIAQVAFRTMQERIQEPTIPPRTLTLAPRLVVRDSCGAYQQ